MVHYAHSHKERPVSEWHRLDDHLVDTGALAEEFASGFAQGWGRLAGLWHDAGKYQEKFQQYILSHGAHSSTPHSAVGALIALNRRAITLPLVIAGHHGGLPDLQAARAVLEKAAGLLEDSRQNGLPKDLEEQLLPREPPFRLGTSQLALWTRFLFSALVDADFLDTEKFYERKERKTPIADLRHLVERLDAFLDRKAAGAEPTAMNQLRGRVLEDCRLASRQPPGFFSLTVPTGGGKTLSALAFALRHAVQNGLRRVIFVVPFTSIIEQTVRVYREALGEEAVIEHHSGIDPEKETPINRLAAENWDASVVVTTSVQFFESLYARKPSRCRKLHRIAQSVVLFDEAQTLEPSLLKPITEVMRNLVSHFGVSMVLCTATQPRLELEAREIVRDVQREFEVVRDRCAILLPDSEHPIVWQQLAERIRSNFQALAIVDRRSDAEELALRTGDECIHLSARMCPAHRLRVLDEIRERLRKGLRCLVVSTQLVEAGVDFDFPMVYRAFAGAGSIAQAAGRCNREGRLTGGGRLQVFFPPQPPPKGLLRIFYDRALTMWREGNFDLQAAETFREFYRRVYSVVHQDPGVLAAERELRFEESAELFRLIDERGEQVVAPYGDWQTRVRKLEGSFQKREALRSLQPLFVTLYSHEAAMLRSAGALVEVVEGLRLWQVVPQYSKIYDDRFGFRWQGPLAAEPDSLIG